MVAWVLIVVFGSYESVVNVGSFSSLAACEESKQNLIVQVKQEQHYTPSGYCVKVEHPVEGKVK